MKTERLDAKAKIPFRELTKSRLFQIFTLPYIQSAITLPTTFFHPLLHRKNQLEATVYLTLISLIVGSAMLLRRHTIAHKCLTFNFHWKSVTKYVIVSTVMAAPFYVIPHLTRISSTLIFTGIGGIIYFAILFAIDHETIWLIRSIINEGKSKLGII